MLKVRDQKIESSRISLPDDRIVAHLISFTLRTHLAPSDTPSRPSELVARLTKASWLHALPRRTPPRDDEQGVEHSFRLRWL